MNPIYIPGPGDEATWPDEVTHPNDPRQPEYYDSDFDAHPPSRHCGCDFCVSYFEEDYDYE